MEMEDQIVKDRNVFFLSNKCDANEEEDGEVFPFNISNILIN